jgi:hypothetical protein
MQSLLSAARTLDWVLLGCFALCLWLVVLAGVSWISGFRGFLRVFTRRPRIKGRKYWFVSLWCGAGSIALLYPFCFTVTVGDEGLYIEPHFYIRPFHRPMRIAWRSVIGCEERVVGHKLRFVELPVSLTILGRAGRAAHVSLREYAAKF